MKTKLLLIQILCILVFLKLLLKITKSVIGFRHKLMPPIRIANNPPCKGHNEHDDYGRYANRNFVK